MSGGTKHPNLNKNRKFLLNLVRRFAFVFAANIDIAIIKNKEIFKMMPAIFNSIFFSVLSVIQPP